MNIMAHPQVRKVLAYYDALEKRDRLALIALAIFLAVLFMYFGLWASVEQYYQESREYRDRQVQLLEYMRRTEEQARNAAPATNQAVVGGQTLLTEVSRTAQAFGIKPARLQPEGSDSVSVWFDSVAFNRLAQWLDELTTQRNISIRQISIDREGEPGKVNARLILSG